MGFLQSTFYTSGCWRSGARRRRGHENTVWMTVHRSVMRLMCTQDFHINLCMDLRAHTTRLVRTKTRPQIVQTLPSLLLIQHNSNPVDRPFFLRNVSSNLNFNAFRKFTVDTFFRSLFPTFYPNITKAAVNCV